MNYSDAELLIRSRRDPEAIAVIYDRYAPAVHAYLARRVDSSVVDDLLSEVFVVVVGARRRFRPHGSGSALPWLYGIAHNVVRSQRRRTAPASAPETDDVDWDAVNARLDAAAAGGDLRVALAALSSSERDLLLLVAWEQLTVTEAAEALEITATAARSRLHRARTRAAAALASAPTTGELA